MFALIVQVVLLIAIAFIVGCVLGCVLKEVFGKADRADVELPGSAATDPASPPAGQPKPRPALAPPEKASVVPATPISGVTDRSLSYPVAAKVGKTPVVRRSAKPGKQASRETPGLPSALENAASSAPDSPADNLKLIRGIGPQNEVRLNQIGITHFVQIAKWTRRDQRDIADALAFPGRIEREEWVPQARKLAKSAGSTAPRREPSRSTTTSVTDGTDGSQGVEPGNLLKKPRDGRADDLTAIDGVGGVIENKMFKLGVFHFDQIASMDADGIRWLGSAVGFPGRAERENWQGESKVLAEGGSMDQAPRSMRGQIKTRRKP